MARSSAAAVANPAPAKRRKPASRHATTQTRRPRRTSGPAKHSRSGAPARTKRATTARAATATAGAAAAPRRAPARKPAPRTRTAAPRTRTAPLVQRLLNGRTGAIADQLLRGRACVAIVFVLLVGIVALNVSLLEMNEGIARTNAQATALEHENAKLRTQLAPLGSSERIQREAVKRGYSLPAAGDVGYVTGSTADNAKLASERMTAPGMGEGVASRPAAQVQEERIGGGTTTTTAPQTPAATAPTPEATPEPTPTPVTNTTPQTTTPPAATQPTANPTVPAAATAP
jgi:cell division protein FtsL